MKSVFLKKSKRPMRRLKNLFFLLSSLFSMMIFGQKYQQEIEKINKWRVEGDTILAKNLLQKIEADAKINNHDELPKIYSVYTKYFFSAENFKEAGKYSLLALQSSNSSKNNEAKAFGNYARAYFFYQLDLPENAMDFAKKAQKYLGKNPQNEDLKANLNYLFYCIYSRWDDFKMSDFYAEQSIKSSEKAKSFNTLASGLSAKSTTMGFQLAKTGNKIYADSIKYYLKKSLSVCKNHSDSVPQYTLGITAVNLANRFYLDYKFTKNPQLIDSINLYLNTLDKLPKLNDFNYELRANALGIKADLAQMDGDKKTAESLLLQAFEMLQREKKRPSYYAEFNIANALQEFYTKNGEYQKALSFADKKLEFNQKEFNQNSEKNVFALEAKYENEKIKEELEMSKQLSKQRRWQNFLYLAIVALGGGLLYFSTKNFRQKIKLQTEESERLKAEKDRAESALLLENETKARLLADQKILKLEHEKIQKQAMINALRAKQKAEMLEEIKTQFSTGDQQKVRSTIQKEQFIDNSLESAKMDFEGINPIFFDNLKEKSRGKLTPLDMKYCAYIFLGLSSKEIAAIFNLEAKSVRMTKYRIKQKLNLQKESSLEDFLKTV